MKNKKTLLPVVVAALMLPSLSQASLKTIQLMKEHTRRVLTPGAGKAQLAGKLAPNRAARAGAIIDQRGVAIGTLRLADDGSKNGRLVIDDMDPSSIDLLASRLDDLHLSGPTTDGYAFDMSIWRAHGEGVRGAQEISGRASIGIFGEGSGMMSGEVAVLFRADTDGRLRTLRGFEALHYLDPILSKLGYSIREASSPSYNNF